MILLLKRFVGLLLFVLISCCLSAQTLAFREFSIQDGLMQSQVDRCFLDSRGYLWIGTRGGFSCFNGETIRNYNTPSNLLGTKVNSFAEDTSGNLYFLNQYGIFLFDGVKFKQLHTSDKRYRSIYIDAENNLWVIRSKSSKYEGGIEVYDLDRDFKRVPSILNQNNLLKSISHGIHLLDNGNKKSILGIYRDQNWKVINLEPYSVQSVNWKEGIRYYLSFFSGGDTSKNWKVNIDSLLQYPLLDSAELIKFCNSLNTNPKIEQKNEYYHIHDKSNQLINIEPQKSKCYTYSLKTKEYFYRYFKDRLGRIWSGTETGLIQIFKPSIIEYDHHALDLTWSIVPVSSDTTLFATFRDDLMIRANDSLVSLRHNCYADKITFYMGNHKFKDGRIALSTGRGLVVLDKDLQCILVDSEREKIASLSVQEMAINKSENILATAIIRGINLYNINSENIEFDKFISFDHPNFQNAYSNDIIIDKKGRYWVGHEKGLSIYDPKNEEWENFSIKDGNFPAGDVATVYKDPFDNYWLGSAQGLVVGNEEEGFQLIDDPLIYGVVNAIDSFDNDHIILGGTFGICILNLKAWEEKRKIRGKVFNQCNGFMAGEPAENAIYRMMDGSLMVGTQSYPVQIFPDRMDLKVHPLNIRVLSINDSLLPFEYNKQISLPYKTDEVRIDFEAIGMYRPGTTKYAYKINKGAWSPWQEEKFVQLDKLGSGSYSFSLKAQTPGIDPDRFPVTTLSFTTSVPLWMEPYFAEVLGSLLIGSLLFVGILAFINYRQRQRNLKHVLAIDYLRIQSLQAQMNPHFVFNVLGTLQNMVLKADTEKANDQLVKLSTLIRRFLESTVQSNLDQAQTTINEQSLEQELELLELYIQFEQLQHEDLFEYTLEIDPKLKSSNISLPPMLIQPFVENAIKHGLMYRKSKGQLWIRFAQISNTLSCTIEDNGVGRKQAQKIQKQSLRIHKSYGTKLVEERIELLNKMNYNISYTIKDRPGGGTIVILKIGL